MVFPGNIALLSLLVFSGVACGTSLQYFATERPPNPLSARSVESVTVFKENPPEKPYRTIGYIEGQQETLSLDSLSGVAQKMRKRAAQIGCDGLLLIGLNNSRAADGTRLYGYRGACIVYVAAEARR